MILIVAAVLALSPPEVRGQQLFTRGTSASGRAVAVTIGGGTTTAAMPCANCHGRDGRGRSEGGIEAPDIRWETLLRRYDGRSVLRAVTMGIGAEGKPLNAVMPRYRLWREDAADLLEYMKRVGTLREPGLTDDAIEVGVLVSPRAADVMKSAIESWAADVNARGGIYARRIVPRFHERAPNQDDVFVYLGDADRAAADWMNEREVPLVANAAADEPGRFVFAVSASPGDEMKALIAAARGAPLRLVPSVHAEDALNEAAGDLLIAARVLPSDASEAALARLQPARLLDQLSILAAARVVEETLRRAGRDVTREAFVDALESTNDLATGYGPPLTFDRSRHHGTSVVHILRFDRQTKTLAPVAR